MLTKVAEQAGRSRYCGGCWKKKTSGCCSKCFSIKRCEHTWEEAEACLEFLRDRQDFAGTFRTGEESAAPLPGQEELIRLLARKDELNRILSTEATGKQDLSQAANPYSSWLLISAGGFPFQNRAKFSSDMNVRVRMRSI